MRESRTDDGAFRFVQRNPLPGYRRAYKVYGSDPFGNDYMGTVMRDFDGHWFAWPLGRITFEPIVKMGPVGTRLEAARLIAPS